ncbi:MAG TPA: hypothetical protein VNJ54_03550 [Plantibacter sp.]|uniref:hypothetical protein n=1 Tax=unclassified Plantibacter TaxID=2624265 RepID=UPI002C3630F0|nr:hypothetical protein [Plantibacter sp.]
MIPQWLRDAPALDAEPREEDLVLGGALLAVAGLDLPIFNPDRAITILATAV